LDTPDNKAIIYTYDNNSVIVKALGKALNGTVEIVNMLGQTMQVKTVSHGSFLKIDTHLNEGVYIVRYTEADGYTQTRKVVLH